MLGFPNRMRSFDEDAGIFRFSGYDGAMEVRFMLEAPALERLAGIARSPDTVYLEAFDHCRDTIEAAAGRAYKKSRKSLIRLSSSDF